MARPANKSMAAHAISTVIDQVDLAFKPEVIVIPVGSSVQFPNSDTVSHQVYSFSPAKRFKLPLYRGKPYSPLRFDEPGIVTLGCNIHDYMLGYILVTDAAFFGITATDGTLALQDLEPGDYNVSIWHPRAREPEASMTRRIHIERGVAAALIFQLSKKLVPAPLKTLERKWDY
jgi:plastocyanin